MLFWNFFSSAHKWLGYLVALQLLAHNPGGRIEGKVDLDGGQVDLLHGVALELGRQYE